MQLHEVEVTHDNQSNYSSFVQVCVHGKSSKCMNDLPQDTTVTLRGKLCILRPRTITRLK